MQLLRQSQEYPQITPLQVSLLFDLCSMDQQTGSVFALFTRCQCVCKDLLHEFFAGQLEWKTSENLFPGHTKLLFLKPLLLLPLLLIAPR